MIYHVAKIDEWEHSKKREEYFPFDFEREGFIHCSFYHQLEGVLDRYYKNEKVVYILMIDENEIRSKVEIEHSVTTNDNFPHIYGAINKNAIIKVEKRDIPFCND